MPHMYEATAVTSAAPSTVESVLIDRELYFWCPSRKQRVLDDDLRPHNKQSRER